LTITTLRKRAQVLFGNPLNWRVLCFSSIYHNTRACFGERSGYVGFIDPLMVFRGSHGQPCDEVEHLLEELFERHVGVGQRIQKSKSGEQKI
jgi:hypothetical protein